MSNSMVSLCGTYFVVLSLLTNKSTPMRAKEEMLCQKSPSRITMVSSMAWA